MSGTSLDGLDIVLCDFNKQNNRWIYRILDAKTIIYDTAWKNRLSGASDLTASDLLKLHNTYGEYIGQEINRFLKKKNYHADIIASHGHTIFHQPSSGFTFQLGHGASIAATTGITTISDFRSLDVALGGQGAPLVPLGDNMLFAEYEFRLNLGGFSNISYNNAEGLQAYDICPVNIALNQLANSLDKDYDNEGMLARSGKIHDHLLQQLNNLDYYSLKGPKSLSREWFERSFLPVVRNSSAGTRDKMHTIVQHISEQIGFAINHLNKGRMLVTGGGAFNNFLIEKLRNNVKHTIILPDELLIHYKEALIFAFLGYLRYKNQYNVLASFTGARSNSISGSVFKT